ncbi:hypothetical protein J7426_21700 [Tropicibacter sp. R16_0]|uniref:hypothetical protein n=1 Tax=Tropicibacter sp. R16_0 TaxID=2821102 RepID=UPI001ADCC874|nr:hypothetical protein [Tropicibacter sp. R16_0]MBO9452893.1 hypothetical protein [Tropicibacter sp. R16_0]
MSSSSLIIEGQREPLADVASSKIYEEPVNIGVTRLVRMKTLAGMTGELLCYPNEIRHFINGDAKPIKLDHVAAIENQFVDSGFMRGDL